MVPLPKARSSFWDFMSSIAPIAMPPSPPPASCAKPIRPPCMKSVPSGYTVRAWHLPTQSSRSGECRISPYRKFVRLRLRQTRRAELRFLEADQSDLPVQSHFEKYFGFLATQITTVVRTVSSHQRGVSRSSRTRGGMRWTPMVLLTNSAGRGRRSRVVLTPRRWRQVCGDKPQATVTRKPDHRGDHEGNR